MVNINNPLIDPPPPEVPLENAPLVRVIAQVRFPPILSIEKKEFVGTFQEAIRDEYPILQPEKTQGFILDPQGNIQTSTQIAWRFIDITGNWRVSLSSNFVALETTAYSSRSNFLERLENIVAALQENFNPTIIERFGLRYVDRLVGQDLTDISLLVKPEIVGVISADFRDDIRQSINESLFIVPDEGGQIIARWGLISGGTTFDPDAIEPITKTSWILDLDMSLSKNREFNIAELMREAKQFSERLYTLFRWSVTDEFLRRFGGEL
ncbi:unknown protein [Stanieria sp. NIES-3757]|nr:unknown protein [Stanieria sp. NIES-3757]